MERLPTVASPPSRASSASARATAGGSLRLPLPHFAAAGLWMRCSQTVPTIPSRLACGSQRRLSRIGRMDRLRCHLSRRKTPSKRVIYRRSSASACVTA